MARLLKVLAGKKNILITTHQHPDPDAIGSSHALAHLLKVKLKDAKVTMSVKGKIGGGLNDAFAKHANLKLAPWDQKAVESGEVEKVAAEYKQHYKADILGPVPS